MGNGGPTSTSRMVVTASFQAKQLLPNILLAARDISRDLAEPTRSSTNRIHQSLYETPPGLPRMSFALYAGLAEHNVMGMP